MAPAPTPGDRVAGRYRLERALGSGGFGTTYAALDERTRRQVAVKVLDLRHLGEWKSVELFEREAAVLRRLDHPRIPAYVDFVPIEADRAGVLVQRLAPGRSLAALLEEEGRLDEARVIALADQVLEVLGYLGGLEPPVVHRDIKPANIVVADDGQVSLVDFGAVKDAAARTSTIGSTVAGTFGFMAPEVLQGSGEPRSDLYALGMTMINLLTGVAPSELPSRRLRPLYHDRVVASSALLGVIDRLIEPVPDDRYVDAAAARVALADARDAGTLADPGADLGALVVARERAHRRAQEEQEALTRRKRQAAEARLARRPLRVTVQRGEGRTRVTIAPPQLVDQLGEQVVWGMVFAFFNPGAFLVVGLSLYLVLGLEIAAGVAIPLAIALWIVVLALLNLAYAQLARRPWYVDLSDEGVIAVHRGDPRKGALLGRARDLTVRLSTPDPSRLGSASFQGGVEIEHLTARDLEHLGEVLGSRMRVR